MTTVIHHTGDPYPAARAIDRALEGHHWRVVVMHAEDGGVIRIAPKDTPLFDPGVLVLGEGEQLIVSDTGGIQIGPDLQDTNTETNQERS
jgi:hypothetical protein